ncbi:MAG TPA: 3-carboxy-cis,cis-muconate cycloisomerase [Chloroflexia bacterium]|nr:3-carboxy-cis,cis-muconate cycloisomerase [Chloroflexia bacterium]
MQAPGMTTAEQMAALFSPDGHLRRMLAFEAALARAEARVGVIPQEAAGAIADACRVELYDPAAIFREAVTAGTPAIPLVKALRAQVAEAWRDFVHLGATSQDVIDTALVLQMRDGLDLLDASLLQLCEACARHAEQHRGTLMPGRTLLQQAAPITFGLKAAHWLSMAVRQVQSLRDCRGRNLVLQFGGAAGTLAALGDNGLRVAQALAEELDLPLPDLPWHAERDRVATVASAMGVTAGAMSKIAVDIVLLAQTEVGELSEGEAPGKGGSSAMPHKRNPVDATFALASSRLALGSVQVILSAMQQEHERAAGGWQAEWQAVPDLFRHTASSVAHTLNSVQGLQVHPERMRANLEQEGGLLMSEALAVALPPKLGRSKAQEVAGEVGRRALEQGQTLAQAAAADGRVTGALSPAEIKKALDPAAYLGSTSLFIDRALAAYRALQEIRADRA